MDYNMDLLFNGLFVVNAVVSQVLGQGIQPCPARREYTEGRVCQKSCIRDIDCKSSKKSCMCDGICGKSCIRNNLRCERLGTVFPHGTIEIIPFNQFGAIAQYSCENDYVLRGAGARVCQGDEKWSGEQPTCVFDGDIEESMCARPPTVSHAVHDGSANQSTFALGTMLNYRCLPGYSLKRDSVVRAWCVGGGVWVGPNMTCAHAGCPLLGDIDNGWVEIIPPGNIGSVARYHCLQGYFLAGRAERVCQSDGTWDGVQPSCETVTCGRPPVIEYATHEGSDDQIHFPSGSQLTYSCNYGYQSDGKSRAMCSGDGEWIGLTLKCSPRNCGFPGDVDNGWRVGYSFTYPNKVSYYCDSGYELQGSGIRTCQPNGRWTGFVPTCIPVECDTLQPPLYGKIQGEGTAYGTEIRFECNEGFKVLGSAVRRCLADRTWSGQDARCEEINCGWPSPFWNGYLIGHKTTVGAIIFFSCNVRTTFEGSTFQTQCNEDGTWSHPPPKCWGQCQVPPVPNATLIGGREMVWVNHNTTIQFQCNDGLVPSQSSDVRCNNGSWTSLPECVPAPCPSPPPHINNGMRIFLGQGHGYKAKYSCFPGYKLAGMDDDSPYLTCHFGDWIGGKPRCEEFYCPNPGSLSHGTVYKKGIEGRFLFKHYIKTIKHGTRLEYECDKDFRLDGPSGATCVNGRWRPNLDDPGTRCVPKKHPEFQKLWRPLEEQNNRNL